MFKKGDSVNIGPGATEFLLYNRDKYDYILINSFNLDNRVATVNSKYQLNGDNVYEVTVLQNSFKLYANIPEKWLSKKDPQ